MSISESALYGLSRLDFVFPNLCCRCPCDSRVRAHRFWTTMKRKDFIKNERGSAASKSAKTKLKRTIAWRQHRRDEPDAFRRAIERWTIRTLLIGASIVLAFEFSAWTVQKV